MKPYRATVNLVYAAASDDASGAFFNEMIIDLQDAGAYIELASWEDIDPSDVVPDSPLADDLADRGEAA